MKTVIEWCPHCDEEVKIRAEMTKQKCPNCGETIVPCAALCKALAEDRAECSKCPLFE